MQTSTEPVRSPLPYRAAVHIHYRGMGCGGFGSQQPALNIETIGGLPGDFFNFINYLRVPSVTLIKALYSVIKPIADTAYFRGSLKALGDNRQSPGRRLQIFI